MSSELAVRGAPVISNMDDLARVAKMLSESSYFTDAKSAAQAGVKVLAGLELGIPAFTAMSGIHIVSGKPTLGANLMAARVKGSGKYDYRVRKLDDEGCVIAFFEGGEEIGVSAFTKQDAVKAGTQNMQKFGRNMMFARAMSNGVRWFTPDIFLTPVYTPEEMGVPVNGEGEIIQARIIEPEKPSELPQQPALTQSPQKTPEAPQAQAEPLFSILGDERGREMINHLFSMGFDETGRTVLLAMVERDVPRFADLTEDEAKKVMAEARRIKAQRDAQKPPFDADPPVKDFDPNAKQQARLPKDKAADLHKALGSLGCKDHPALALEVLEREVDSFTELTIPESVKIYEAAIYKFGGPDMIEQYEARKAAA